MAWTFHTLGGEALFASVKATNFLAFQNSLRLGYDETPIACGTIRSVSGELDEVAPGAPADEDPARTLWTLKLRRDAFFARFPLDSFDLD